MRNRNIRYVDLKTQEGGGYDGVIDDPISTPFSPDMILQLLKELHPSAELHEGGITFPPHYFKGVGEGTPCLEEVISGGGPDFLSHLSRQAEGDLITLTIVTGDVIFDPIEKGSATYVLSWIGGAQLRLDEVSL